TKSAYVRCYEGHVFATGPGIGLRAGIAGSGTTTTLAEPGLVGDPVDWKGATLKIVGGTNQGEERPITGFDPATGTVTVAPAFPGAIDNTSEYLITTNPQAPIVALGPNEGTTIHDGRPSPSYKIAPLQFAEGRRN